MAPWALSCRFSLAARTGTGMRAHPQHTLRLFLPPSRQSLNVRLPGDHASVILMEPGDAVGILSSVYEHRVEEEREGS